MELINQIDETICFNENNIRILGSYSEPWFVAKDICNILEIKDNRSALRIIPDKWKGEQILPTLGGKQITSVVNEAGLYKLIMRSNKPIAEKFQEVVCEDILPTLRKRGEYKIQSIMDRNKELEEEKNKIKEELDKKEHLLDLHVDESIKKSNRIKLLEIKNSRKSERTEQGKNVVYLITNEYLVQEKIYIIGKAVDLANRLSQYNKNAEHDVIYCRECNSAKQMSLIEDNILCKLDKYRERANRDRFILPNDKDISLFTNVIDGAANWFCDVDKDVIIEKTEKKEKDKEYYEDNKEYIKEYKRQHYQENKEEIDKKHKSWYEDNVEQIKIYNQQYREENIDKINEQKKIYKEEHKEEYKNRDAAYYMKNKEKIHAQQKIYNEKNRENILKQRKEYYNANIQEIRKKDRDRNPKITCECGLIICKKSLSAHQKSAIHGKFLALKNKNNESKQSGDEVDVKVDQDDNNKEEEETKHNYVDETEQDDDNTYVEDDEIEIDVDNELHNLNQDENVIQQDTVEIQQEKVEIKQDETKECVTCKQNKSITEYEIRRKECKACRKIKLNERINNGLDILISEIDEAKTNLVLLENIVKKIPKDKLVKILSHFTVGRKSSDNKNDMVCNIVDHFKKALN